MKTVFPRSLSSRPVADCIVVPFFEGKNKAEPATADLPYNSIIAGPLLTKDFLGKEDEMLLLYVPSKGKEKRIILIGMGKKKKVDLEEVRNCYALALSVCKQKKLHTVNLLLPDLLDHIEDSEIVRSTAEGVFLSNYAYDKHLSEKVVLIQTAAFIGVEKAEEKIIEKAKKIALGVYLVRDLVNNNADDVTPQYLSSCARDLAKESSKLRATVFGKKEIEREKMELLLAVNRGSSHDPAFIIMEYKGDPASKDLTALVGKGITYDSGGLSLKPSTSMDTMRTDMAGAATVLGIMKIAASLQLKKNIVALIPATENMLDAKSYKPGDVYGSYSGKTVEVINTDAEGRLVLADALSYAVKKFKPKRIIDFATLTGAILIALGEEISGIFTNNDEIAHGLEKASKKTGEWVCQLPLFEKYKEMIKSQIADMKNVGERSAGSITAALFLEAFVEDIPWVHIDIAGTSFFKKRKGYHLAFGTGMGARLLIEFLENL